MRDIEPRLPFVKPLLGIYFSTKCVTEIASALYVRKFALAKRGRPAATIQLITRNDPALHQYASLDDALRKNTSIIASLIDPQLLTDCVDEGNSLSAPDLGAKPARKRKK